MARLYYSARVNARFSLEGGVACLYNTGMLADATGILVPHGVAEVCVVVFALALCFALWVCGAVARLAGNGLPAVPQYPHSLFPNKWDQFRFYIIILAVASAFVVLALHFKMGYCWEEATRFGIVQTLSVVTTTGSVVSDTTLWWTPITFIFVALSMCGGMAGSTTGGLKVMRVLILGRNVRYILHNRLHPKAVNPVRLNGRPLSNEIITNVMVIFFVYVMVILVGVLALMLSGINSTESIGAMVSCITGYGPGLGLSGGFGSYAGFTIAAKWICTLAMLMGRLECLSVLIVLMPSFWKK